MVSYINEIVEWGLLIEVCFVYQPQQLGAFCIWFRELHIWNLSYQCNSGEINSINLNSLAQYMQ